MTATGPYQVRCVRFDFDSDDVPFNWQPERPSFGMQCNLISFFAPGFEKMIVDATREAMPLIRDPQVQAEADSFLRQEAQHAAAHRRHLRALIRRWPGLQETMDQVIASYDELTRARPLAWRLAYTACLEATFTPYFTVFLDHEETLFAPGDERVSSLMLWHFIEEMEHRSSALRIYDAVHGSYPYRLRTMLQTVRHIGEILHIVHTGFCTHVPAEHGGELGRLIPDGFSLGAVRDVQRATKEFGFVDTYDGVPKSEIRAMVVGLIRSQGRSHDPAQEQVPALATRWFSRYDEDAESAERWYSVGVGRTAS